MKIPKYTPIHNFTPPRTAPTWIRRFKAHRYFTTRTGTVQYQVYYIHTNQYHPDHSYVILESQNTSSWYRYRITEDNHKKYIEA